MITSVNSKSGSAYVVYNGVEQTFKISSSREHNGSVMGDTTMENGDSIIIKLESKLKLTEAGKDKFDKLGPAEFYHEFDVSMKKYLQKEAAKYDVIGTEMVDYTYTLSGNGLNQVQKGSIQDAAGLETLTLKRMTVVFHQRGYHVSQTQKFSFRSQKTRKRQRIITVIILRIRPGRR